MAEAPHLFERNQGEERGEANISFSVTAACASTVTSRPVSPVPPVEITAFTSGSAIQAQCASISLLVPHDRPGRQHVPRRRQPLRQQIPRAILPRPPRIRHRQVRDAHRHDFPLRINARTARLRRRAGHGAGAGRPRCRASSSRRAGAPPGVGGDRRHAPPVVPTAAQPGHPPSVPSTAGAAGEPSRSSTSGRASSMWRRYHRRLVAGGIAVLRRAPRQHLVL